MLVTEIVRLVEMAHGVLDKNSKTDQIYLVSMASWIKGRKKKLREVGRLVPPADDDDDIVDNISMRDEIVGSKRERPINDYQFPDATDETIEGTQV